MDRFDIIQKACVSMDGSDLHLKLEDCCVNENVSDSEHVYSAFNNILNPG